MRSRRLLLVLGDIIVFYLALFLTLWLRWGFPFHYEVAAAYLLPFSIILAVGLWLFYGMRLYDSRFGYGSPLWITSVSTALILQFITAVLFFYFIWRRTEGISPRGTLFLFFLVFGVLLFLWRASAERFMQSRQGERMIIFADAPEAKNLAEWLTAHPALGYKVVAVLPENNLVLPRLQELIEEENLKTVIASQQAIHNLVHRHNLEDISRLPVKFWDLVTFYEIKLGKIPVHLISDAWVLENIIRQHETPLEIAVKRLLDFATAILFLCISLPFWPLVALLVKLSSLGPIFINQLRVGKGGKVFMLTKFRSMYVLSEGGLAEPAGPQWTQANDSRITFLGRFLRATHLDELPELLSIIKGDLSFVGPRPERAELVKELREKIPFYDIRHYVKPGFTGWAQINYPYGASVEDAKEKLEYELYYLKHHSLLLDLSIILKTIRLLFQNPHRP